ncbi:MAG: hypothetical protein COX81_02360 [Candidatus Magasanikbacteria bacterium CG_4_10_14_0_2_um_filter_37_12]|uniref:Uncharacterized protein n=1 Tax=Candidatus Magasanikbacteria bacterium CG_4_10_14_0_2_um_filter_37_12 TaxID=1974637 RepID=A0A2M7V7Y5_9BACT|nr:MAG: hypothetical protein COX81_02360 [Candidatus Magasanikbacteria bacterium CG_4_10_14_0_2_um_filter_37_12]
MLAVVTTFIASHFSEICTSALDTNTGLRVGECAPHWSSITFIVLIVVAIYTLAVFFGKKIQINTHCYKLYWQQKNDNLGCFVIQSN